MEPILKRFKSYVDADDLSGAILFMSSLEEEEDPSLAHDYLFQKVYLHACLKKRTRVVEYMNTLFETLDPIERLALDRATHYETGTQCPFQMPAGLRQMFAYGGYLLQK